MNLELLGQWAKEYSNKRKSFEPNERYEESVELYYAIKPHADDQFFPDKVLREKAPNELEAEWEYRKSIYLSKTSPYWTKAVGQIQRIWNKENFAIKFGENDIDEDDASQYFIDKLNIADYFEHVVTPECLSDANAVLLVWDSSIMEEQDGYEGWKPLIFNSPKVWHYTDTECLVLSNDKSEIKTGRGVEREGLVLYYCDSEYYRIIAQFGEKHEYKFQVVFEMRHDLGYSPAKALGGFPRQDDGEVYYASYFQSAIPLLNEALRDGSTLQMSKYTQAFPQRWEYADECETCNGDGYVNDVENGNKTCGTCNGTGKRALHSPTSVMEISLPNRMNDSGDVNIPPAGYIQPDPTILEFLDKQIDGNIEKAFAMLNLDVSNSSSKGSDVALSKQIDREELFSFLQTISSNLFGLMRWTVNTIGSLRYGERWEGFMLKEPSNYQIRSEYDIIEEMDKAPKSVRRFLIQDYLDRRFGARDMARDAATLLNAIDSLSDLEMTEILALKGSGDVEGWEIYLHRKGLNIIDDLAREVDDFWQLGFTEQRQLVEDMARELAPSPRAVSADDIIRRLA